MWSQASPRCCMSHRDPSTAQGCWGGSQVASQKATIFVTASCLQEIIPFPSCTVSERWLDCCCPRLRFPVKTSHKVPDNQGIASVSFCRILATLQNPGLQHLILHKPFLFPTKQPPLVPSALPTPAQNPLCLLLPCPSSVPSTTEGHSQKPAPWM